MGFSGMPNWIQGSWMPKCPKTNKPMRFLCQLTSSDKVRTEYTNIEMSKAGDDFKQSYFKNMNFWGDGDLFVFFEPESKMACYFIQHT